jgi:hypothetical protein
VTTAFGTPCKRGHGTPSAAGSSPSGHEREVAPSPIDSISSSACPGRPCARGHEQRDQRGLRLGLREFAQPAQGLFIVEVRDMQPWLFGFVVDRRVVGTQAERGVQRPFVRFGRGIELVDGRRARERGAGRVFAHDDGAVRPIEHGAGTRDAGTPALEHGCIERHARLDL